MSGISHNNEESEELLEALEKACSVILEFQKSKRVVSLPACVEFFKIFEEYKKAKERLVREQRANKLTGKPENMASQAQPQALESLSSRILAEIRDFLATSKGQKAEALRAYFQDQVNIVVGYQDLLNLVDLLAPLPVVVKQAEVAPVLESRQHEEDRKAWELLKQQRESKQESEEYVPPPDKDSHFTEALLGRESMSGRTYLRGLDSHESAAAFDPSAELASLLTDLEKEREEAQTQKRILQGTDYEYLKQRIEARLRLIVQMDSLLQNGVAKFPDSLRQAQAQLQEICRDKEEVARDSNFSARGVSGLPQIMQEDPGQMGQMGKNCLVQQLRSRPRTPAIALASAPTQTQTPKKWTGYQWAAFLITLFCAAACLAVLTCGAIALAKQAAFWIVPLSTALPLTIAMAVLFLVLVVGMYYAYAFKGKQPGAGGASSLLLGSSSSSSPQSSAEIRPGSRGYSLVGRAPRSGSKAPRAVNRQTLDL